MKKTIAESSRQNYSAIERKIVKYIQENVKDKWVLIGLSGGIDSALSCALAVKALGPKKVKALIIKNIRYSNEQLNIARGLAKHLGVKTIEINSNGIRLPMLKQTGVSEKKVVDVSTLDARITDMLIRTVAQQKGLIYLGSINGTERLTGWYPKGALFGDICPIADLLKFQVQGLARHMGLPEEIIETVSGDASRICSGCGNLPDFVGISYDDLDKILYFYQENKLSRLKGVRQNIIDKVTKRIKDVDHKNQVFSPYPAF